MIGPPIDMSAAHSFAATISSPYSPSPPGRTTSPWRTSSGNRRPGIGLSRALLRALLLRRLLLAPAGDRAAGSPDGRSRACIARNGSDNCAGRSASSRPPSTRMARRRIRRFFPASAAESVLAATVIGSMPVCCLAQSEQASSSRTVWSLL